MKKALSIALALVLAIGMLAGCGGTETAENAEVTAISIWHSSMHAKKYFEEKVADFAMTLSLDKITSEDVIIKKGKKVFYKIVKE